MNNPQKRHRARVCEGTDLPPCIKQTLQFYILLRLGIYILIGPPSITNFTTSRQVDEGGSLELRCEAQIPKLQSINQTVSFQWANYGQDGKQKATSGDDERMTTASYQDPNRLHFFYGILHLSPASRSDNGSYTCRISGSVDTSK